jgi:hypothetical protein
MFWPETEGTADLGDSLDDRLFVPSEATFNVLHVRPTAPDALWLR